MKMASRNLFNRFPRIVTATAVAVLLAVASIAAQQFETFQEEFEGELWEMIGVVRPTEGGGPVNGVVFTEANGYLYLSDDSAGAVVVYDQNYQVVPLDDADWAVGQVEDPLSPVFGWIPNQLTTAIVNRDGVDTTAILVSDIAIGAHRVFAFTTAGEHLFTLHLDTTGLDTEPGFVNGVAMGPNSKFVLTPEDNVQLIGSFAAAWSQERQMGGTLAFHGGEFPFTPETQLYEAAPTVLLTGDEHIDGEEDPVHSIEPFGLTFDGAGNLYITDSITERLSVYGAGPTFTRRFTFGTPQEDDGTTEEFFQSYGIQYWPDETGVGRIFVADAVNNRVLAYRPNFEDRTLDSIFELDGIGKLDGFPYGLAIDARSGRMAIGDDIGDEVGQRAWILKTPDLAAFNVEILDSDGVRTDVVCIDDSYTVRYRLTVPAGRGTITGVAPQLTIDGTPTDVEPVAGQNYPGTSLSAGNVVTYSYPLTAPSTQGVMDMIAGVDMELLGAGHVLTREFELPVSSCLGEPPVMTAEQSPTPQLSGWTAIRPGEEVSVELTAVDELGVNRIDYQLDGASHTIPIPPVVYTDGSLDPRVVTLTFRAPGLNTVRYRARNTNYVQSPEESLVVRLVEVYDLSSLEGTAYTASNAVRIGAPAANSGVTFTATGLPPGLAMDPATGFITGTLPFDSDGVYPVTVIETRGAETTQVSFIWTVLNKNLPPVVQNDLYTFAEDTVLTVPAAQGVLANDTNEDTAPMNTRLVSGPATGVLVLEQDGSLTYTPVPNFHGDVTFVYLAADGVDDSLPATVTLRVTPVNDPPVAVNDTLAASEDTPINYAAANLLGNDTDIDGDTLTIASVTSVTGGTVVLNANGTVTFMPAANFTGAASFTYVATDGNLTSTATVTVNVTAVNDPPVAVADALTATEDTVATFTSAQLLANDTDAENGPLSLASVTNGTGGTVSLSGTDVIFTPAPNFTGAATFTYRITDGNSTSNAATVTVTVAPVNDAPVAVPDTLQATQGQAATFAGSALLGNDTDVDNTNAQLSILSVATGTGGTVTLNANGTVTFTPAPGFSGPATFTYTVTDGSLTSTATVTVNVTAFNAPPVANADTVNATEDTVATIPAATLLANDTDPEGTTLTIASVANGTGGTVALNGTNVIFTPSPNFNGVATFTYRVTDGGQLSAPATVTVNVAAVNDPPTAAADAVTSAGAAPIEIPVLANDADIDGGVLSLGTFTQPTAGGVVTSSGNLLIFTPTPGFVGTVTFSYTVLDGNGGSATATVSVTVTGAVCAGPATALVRKQLTMNTGSRLEGSVQVMTAADVTFNGGTLAGDLMMLGTPQIVINGTPAAYGGNVFGAGATTPTSHRVTINSGISLGSIVSRTNAVALPTVAAPPASTGTRNVALNNPTDSPGDFATLRDLSLNSNVGPVAVPAGTYRTFIANWNTAFVIGVAGATTPSVYNFESLTLNSGSSLQVVGPVIVTVKNSVAFNGPAGATAHPEWLTLRVAANGGLSLNSGSSLYGYAEVPNGPVTINDTTQLVGGLAADSLTLNSNGRLILRPACQPNSAPTVSAGNRSDARGSAVSVQISGSDEDNDALTYSASGLPPGVTMDASGLITGTLTTSGTYTVTVTVTDADGATGTATFTWTVVTPNQLPVLQNDTVSSVGAAPVTIPVLANDSDPDGGTLSIISFTVPTGGTVTTSGNQLVFTPNPGFVGTATFTYTVSDGQGGTAFATVTITVAAAPTCSLNGYLTYSQGGWGNSGIPGQFLAAHFADVYPAGHVTIGGSKTLKFTSSSAVKNFLPQGGSPSVLTSSLVNPSSSPAGNFAAQLLALRLAVDFSAAGVTKSGLGQLQMVSGPLAGYTVDQVLALANTVIGGTTSALPTGMTISTLNGILDSLNLNFHEGTDNKGLLRCAGGAPTCTAVTMATTASGSTLNGTAGNIRSFSAGGVNVKVSAFARAKSNGAWSTAYLGAWSVGMGVTDGSEGNGSGDTHKLDNVGDRLNYMLFEFSQPVVVTKAYLSYIGVSSNATVWIGTKTDPYNNHLTLSDSLLASLGTPEQSTGSSTQAHWRAFNGGATAGNVLVIAANTSGSSDAFKVAQLEFFPCAGSAPVNQPPTVSAGNRSDNIGATVNLQIAGNDPENGTLTYSVQGLPAGLTMNTAGKITGSPTKAGTYNVTVTVKDAANATASDTFVWTVVQPNRAPNSANDSVATNPNKTVTVDVLANDTDADGDSLTITAVTQPAKGSVSIQSGKIKYVAPSSGTGTTSFTYTASDGRGGVDTATVTVTLTNPVPVATDDKANVVKSSSKTIAVLSNDALSGLSAKVTIVSQPSKGSVTVNSDGTITYRAPSSTGSANFTYKVTTSAGSDTGVVAITITSSSNGSGHSQGNHGSCSH